MSWLVEADHGLQRVVAEPWADRAVLPESGGRQRRVVGTVAQPHFDSQRSNLESKSTNTEKRDTSSKVANRLVRAVTILHSATTASTSPASLRPS